MKPRVIVPAVVVILVIGIIITGYIGRMRFQQMTQSLVGKQEEGVRRILGTPDRVDNAMQFNQFQRGMRAEGLPLYKEYVEANGSVWHYNRTGTRRLTVLFDADGRVEKIIATDWPSLPSR